MDERIGNIGSSAPGPSVRDYAEVGARVASILNAAEEAARQIRRDAERAAETTRREAESEAERYANERRRDVDGEVERVVAGAVADADAVRDTARAAAQRIAQEGHRRLAELRDEARALERRFESAVDELRDLVAQLEDVVGGAARRDVTAERPAYETRDAEGPQGEEADLSDVLRPAPERAQPSGETGESQRDHPVRSHGERPLS
jgi:hypothetical protein